MKLEGEVADPESFRIERGASVGDDSVELTLTATAPGPFDVPSTVNLIVFGTEGVALAVENGAQTMGIYHPPISEVVGVEVL